MCVTHRWPLRNAARDRAALARMRDSTDVPRTTGRETQMLRISGLTSDGQASARPSRRRALAIASAVTIVAVLAAGIPLAPPALADPSESFKNAVASARSESSCGPLRYSPVVEQVAEISNHSTDQYLNHAVAHLPVGEPYPGLKDLREGLKDLGYHGTKGTLLSGAAKNEANAIKGALLEGFDKLPDCSYTDFGVSLIRNESHGYYLTSLVLAGP
jgi:hypothetical protein